MPCYAIGWYLGHILHSAATMIDIDTDAITPFHCHIVSQLSITFLWWPLLSLIFLLHFWPLRDTAITITLDDRHWYTYITLILHYYWLIFINMPCYADNTAINITHINTHVVLFFWYFCHWWLRDIISFVIIDTHSHYAIFFSDAIRLATHACLTLISVIFFADYIADAD